MTKKIAELTAVTMPTILGKDGTKLTPEQLIAYMARVSSPDNQENHETAPKLLRYLVEHSHWSPFDMVNVVIRLETSRGIMAQVLRHWSFRFQEFSQRYAQVDVADVTFDHVEMRNAGDTNRQGSTSFNPEATEIVRNSCELAVAYYTALVEAGIAPETSRFVLPLAIPTHAYMSGSVRSWMTYFWQRLDPHAQKEHRKVAWAMFYEFRKEFPMVAELILSGRPTFVVKPWAQLPEPEPYALPSPEGTEPTPSKA